MDSLRTLKVAEAERVPRTRRDQSLYRRFVYDLRRTSRPHDTILKLVIGYKILGGILLVLLAGALLGLWRDQEMMRELRIVIGESNLGANNRFLRGIADWAGLLTGRRALGLGAIALGYGMLELIEAAGLTLRRRWAEYLTALATSLFLPIEIREIAVHPTPLRILTFLVNLGMVIYLIRAKQLFVGESEDEALGNIPRANGLPKAPPPASRNGD